MFSSIFGKRRSSPVEDDAAPIPGHKPDDFVVVDPMTPGGALYPSIAGGTYPSSSFPQRPAPPLPPQPRAIIDQTFHYLQGVPFSMCRELQMASNKDSITTEVGDLLAFLTNENHPLLCLSLPQVSPNRSVLCCLHQSASNYPNSTSFY